MEEKPRRDTPRARDPRAPFNAPDQNRSAGGRPPRRGAPPAVTFQPPGAEGHSEETASAPPRKAPRKAARPVPPQPQPAAEPPKAASAEADPAAAKAAPAKKVAKKVAPAKKAAPVKTTRPAAKKAAKAVAPTTALDIARTLATPDVARTPATPDVARTPAIPSTPATPDLHELWSSLLDNPAQAPDTLAHQAVRLLGPRARSWADETRARYPRATPDALARLATRRFARSAALRATASATAGLYTPAALLATAALTHAELVLHLAAAYGKEARAEDLLRLAPLEPRRLAGAGAVWVALRLTNRVLPGSSLLAAVLTSQSAIEAVAVRARRHFRVTPSTS